MVLDRKALQGYGRGRCAGTASALAGTLQHFAFMSVDPFELVTLMHS
jgi:hypothetical protein